MNIKEFKETFPDEESCLKYLFDKRHNLKGYKRVKGRPCFQNGSGRQIYPLKGSIFEKSSTPLELWFYAIYLFSVSKNGVSGKELQRQLGVTYKCAWRIGHKIREAMKQDRDLFTGTVEVDETYAGGRRKGLTGRGTKKPILFGMVERGGKARIDILPDVKALTLTEAIHKNIHTEATVITDDFVSYKFLKRTWNHHIINHSDGFYGYTHKGLKVNTNSVEGLWSIVKRSIRGTHVWVSKEYLHRYVDEIVFRYNHRENSFYRILDGV